MAALNELKGLIGNASGINDAAPSAGSTYSSQKIEQQISAAITALVNGAPTALDTLKELADAVISAEGGVFSPSGTPLTDKQRTVLVEGKNTAKNTQNPLDPADFPVVTAVSQIPNGGGARLRGTNNFYLRRDTGQLLEFVGTPVSG